MRDEITPGIVAMAKEFADFDAEKQAQFFDALHTEVSTWDNGMDAFRKQMVWAYRSNDSTAGGRQIMQAIAAE